MKAKNPLSSLHCFKEVSLQTIGFLAEINYRIIHQQIQITPLQ